MSRGVRARIARLDEIAHLKRARAVLLGRVMEPYRRLGWRVRRTRTTSLAPKLMHVAGGVAGQATPKVIARSARETTSGTIRYGPYRPPS